MVYIHGFGRGLPAQIMVLAGHCTHLSNEEGDFIPDTESVGVRIFLSKGLCRDGYIYPLLGGLSVDFTLWMALVEFTGVICRRGLSIAIHSV